MRAKRWRTSRILGFVLLVLMIDVVCAWAQAEGVVRGEILAAADRSAVGHATVTLSPVTPGEPLRGTTDAAGRFAFARTRPGDYVLSVSADGFAPREVRLVVAPREVRSLTLPLDVERVAVSVDVVAESPLSSTHSPSSTLLTPERLDHVPLAQRTNLPDAIVTAAPGMIRGHDDFVHIRGHEVALNPSINGVQFWENAHSVFSAGLGMDYIDSVNVMTGGFSAEYGNRFGGILDVVTKSGFTMRNRGSVTLGSGTAQRHNVGVEFGGQGDRLGYYVNLGGFTSDRFLSPPSPRSIHNTGRGLRSFARVDFRATDPNHLNLVVTGDGVNFEIPMEERDVRLRPNFKNLQRARSQSAVFAWNHVRSSNLVVHTAAYERWSSVRQLPEAIDQYGAQTHAGSTVAISLVPRELEPRYSGRAAPTFSIFFSLQAARHQM